MGEPSSSDSWKKLVIAKTNDQWISMSYVKRELVEDSDTAVNTGNFSLDYEQPSYNTYVKAESVDVSGGGNWQADKPPATPELSCDPLADDLKKKGESSEERAARLTKMSAYAAQRLANELPEQRAARLKRMSEYAAKRLANETSEQRAKRLARMSAYAAKRLAQETPEQRSARLTRMSAYAARRHALKKMHVSTSKDNSLSSDKLADVSANDKQNKDFL